MSSVTIHTCPGCGSTRFSPLAPDRLQCDYCGTILTRTLPSPAGSVVLVRCPRCAFDNEQSASYCKSCGALLRGRPVAAGKGIDPGIVSMYVSFFGASMFPFGAGIGLYLAYRARERARRGEGKPELARAAIIFGWFMLVLQIVPLIVGAGLWGYGLCATLTNALVEMW